MSEDNPSSRPSSLSLFGYIPARIDCGDTILRDPRSLAEIEYIFAGVWGGMLAACICACLIWGAR